MALNPKIQESLSIVGVMDKILKRPFTQVKTQKAQNIYCKNLHAGGI
jgi:hypothetical protein